MKHIKLHSAPILIAVLFFSLLSFTGAMAQTPVTDSMTRKPSSKGEKKLQEAFSKRVKDYVAVREQVRKKLPPISKDSTPEQIDAYQKRFLESLRAARTYAKPGYIFTPGTADYFRALIKAEFKGTDRAELRETILEAETGGVPMRVNYPYPETKEQAQIPPTLLLKLPQLPKEVKYRFVRRHALLVDTDNGLIVDYMLNALP